MDDDLCCEWCDEHGVRQLVRTSPLGAARLAKALYDALRDRGYVSDEEAVGADQE